jgi:hypothetical protein
MPNVDNELKRDLECLRLAADLIHLSRTTLNRELQAHCIQMASYWSAQTDRNAKEDLTNPR